MISSTQNGEATNYTYGLECISAQTGKIRTEYVYDGRGSVAAEVSYNNAWYTLGGGLAKKTTVSKSYSPFGELLTENVSGFGYNGEYYNAETGMIYLRARFYAPEMNRFSQKDILRGSAFVPQSLNRYLYVQNDPINLIDPSGMSLKSWAQKISSGAKSVVNTVKTVTSNAVNTVRTVASNAVNSVKTAASNFVSSVKTAVTNLAASATSAYNTAKTAVQNFFGGGGNNTSTPSGGSSGYLSSYVGDSWHSGPSGDSDGNDPRPIGAGHYQGYPISANAPRIADVNPASVYYCEKGKESDKAPTTPETPKKGTYSLSLGANANIGVGVSASIAVVFDRAGNVDFQWSYAVPGVNGTASFGVLDAGIGIMFQYTDAATVHDLYGRSSFYGASAGAGWYVGGDVISFSMPNELDGDINGFQIGAGYGIGVDAHVGITDTKPVVTSNDDLNS